jgi:signal transduction histidine kinase
MPQRLKPNHSLSIAAPLGVMLLLTLISGITTYQLTSQWQQSATHVTQSATQAVLLANARADLERIREEWPKNPELASAHWQALQKQVQVLWSAAQIEPISANTNTLQKMLAITQNEHNLSRLDQLLERESLNISLIQFSQQLNSLAEYTSYVAVAITSFMIALGAILMLVTARNLTRWMQALVASRDLNIRLQEEERRRIAGELHDGVMQDLIDLKRQYSSEKLDKIVSNLRRVCQNLKPQILVDLGLIAALEALAQDLREAGISNVRLALDIENLDSLPSESELTLFRIIQELFSNIRRHSGAQHVIVTLAYHPEENSDLRGYIQDDGCGFDTKQKKSGSLGLVGVQERISQLGGTSKIESKPGQGCRFNFQIPVDQKVAL